jgi:hypothetical protein
MKNDLPASSCAALFPRETARPGNEEQKGDGVRMQHPMHETVVELVEKAIGLMDAYLRDRLELSEYSSKLKELDADSVLDKYKDEFKSDVRLIYYLDALMMLSSLQNELDFQVAEYGGNVATEDIKMLREMLHKFGRIPPECGTTVVKGD